MEYLYFTFDNTSSEVYNIIIQNKGEDLSYPSQASFENQLVGPLYQGTNFLAGVNKTARTFDFSCWADSLTRKQVIDLINWLNPNKVGYLQLDYNPNFRYKVKVASITPFKHVPFNDDDTVNYEFSVSFVTIDDFAATSVQLYNSTAGASPDGFEVGYVNGVASELYLYNFYNLPFYLNFEINSNGSFLIAKDDVVHYQYPVAGDFTIDSRYGFCLNQNNELIEASLLDDDEYVNLGAMGFEPKFEYLDAVVTTDNIYIDRTLTIYDRIVALENQGVYNKNNLYQAVLQNKWVEGQIVKLKIVKATKLTLTADSGLINYSFRYRDNF